MSSARNLVAIITLFVVMFLFVLIQARSSAQAATNDLLISEYVEGSSNNKAIEIYNGTGAAVDLAAGNYTLQYYFNGNTTPLTTINLTGTIADGDVHVVVDNDSSAAVINVADQISNSSFFNGDDTIVLLNNGVIIDVIGQLGVDPGSQWGSGDASTQNNTLQRLNTICIGDSDETDVFVPADQWLGFPQDTFSGLGSHTANCGPAPDTPPAVSQTSPINTAINVAVNSDIVIDFDEPVIASGSWYTLSCTSSGSVTAVVSGGPQSWTLNPTADLAVAESCTVTVLASQITDQDGTADNMTADYQFTFDTILGGNACGDPATGIHSIQGTGTQSALAGTAGVTVEGVVVGDFQDTITELGGFYIQEEDSDADTNPATSEGIFVFDNGFGTDVVVGDTVRVTGTVTEFETNTGSGAYLTQLTTLTSFAKCGSGASVTPASVSLPVSNLSDWEAFEGMLVNVAQPLTVSETYLLGRYGEVSLSAGRLYNPTNITTPGASAAAQQELNDRSRIILDDNNAQQNIDPTFHPSPGLTASNTLRSGYTVTGLTAVLEQRFSEYRLQPVGAVNFDSSSNARTAAPAPVGGSLQVASFNVLNYFNGNGSGGGFPTARGADTAAEFTRQRDKIVAAISALDADIVGLMEIENDGYGSSSAIQDLVNGLNAVMGAGTYTFVDPGVSQIGTDQIAVGLLYKPATVSLVGNPEILDSSIDPLFLDTKNRPVLTQTFEEISSNERLTIAVNHLKSKGSSCDANGDPDAGDGQGNCNGVRTDAATALVNWLATDPTGSGDPDFMIIGDLNAYAMEDPITAIKNAGYTNLIELYGGLTAYSYVFDGQAGYLDHALATASLTSQVVGVVEWHINADEPIVLDYNTEFKSANHINTLYSPDAYRASDHDPVLVGLDLGGSSPTPTPLPTATNTPLPTATNTPLPTATNTPLPTATNTPLPTATNTPLPTATNTPQPTATSTPPPASFKVYVSSASSVSINGAGFADEDILVFDSLTNSWSQYFDGSDVGLSGAGARDINAFHIADDGSILFSISGSSTLPDVGSVDDSDIIQFMPTSLGDNTAGTFSLYFDGSDVGLTSNGEDIDALYVADDGRILISTHGGYSVPGVSGADEDVIEFTPTSLGETTAGSWSLVFDGSDAELGDSSEDTRGLWVDANNDLYLNANGTFAVTGASGDASDIYVCSPISLGVSTSCTFSFYFDGSANGIGSENLDGIFIEK